MRESPIYLDNHATTQVDPRVKKAMDPYWDVTFGNPSGAHHAYGRQARSAVDTARDQVADFLGAWPHEVVWTSGATESNNLAIKGVARAVRSESGRNHVVTCATEHKCVLNSVYRLDAEGFEVTVLPVDRQGLVDLHRLCDTVTERTALVSIMAANNEVGTLAPLGEIARIAHAKGAILHSDAAQAVGKVPIDVAATGIDLLSLSGHKVYGPKGVGALYVRSRPDVPLEPIFDGGGQEGGLRPGTLAVPLIVGLGTACVLAQEEMGAEAPRLRGLRDRLWDGLIRALDGVNLNGHPTERLPGNLNFRVPGIDGRALLAAVPEPGLAASSTSACASGGRAVSHVLAAMGQTESEARGAVRLGLGRFTTDADVERALKMILDAVAAPRRQTEFQVNFELGLTPSPPRPPAPGHFHSTPEDEGRLPERIASISSTLSVAPSARG